MKKEYEVSLHSNMIFNVLKYIVLIFAFLMVGVFNVVSVKAAKCDVEYPNGYVSCDTNETGVSEDNIRISMNYNSSILRATWFIGASIHFKICAIGSGTSDCTIFTLFSEEKIWEAWDEYLRGTEMSFDRDGADTSGRPEFLTDDVTGVKLVINRKTLDISWSVKVDGKWISPEAAFIMAEREDSGDDAGGLTFVFPILERHVEERLKYFVASVSSGSSHFQEVGFRIELFAYMGKYNFFSEPIWADKGKTFIAAGLDVEAIDPTDDNSITISEKVWDVSGVERNVVNDWRNTHNPTIEIDSGYTATPKVCYSWSQQKPTNPTCKKYVNSHSFEPTIPSYTDPEKLYTGYYYLYVHAQIPVLGGIIFGSSQQEFKYDNDIPRVTTVSYYKSGTEESVKHTNWYQAIDVKATYEDKGSGIQSLSYCISGSFLECDGTWILYTSTKEEGGTAKITVTFPNSVVKKYIHFKVVDNAGNQHTYLGKRILQIDTKGPTRTTTLSGDSTWVYNRIVTVDFDDEGSGKISQIYYKWTKNKGVGDPQKEGVSKIPDVDGKVEIGAPSGSSGKYYLRVVGVDAADNVSVISESNFPYYIDNKNPVIGSPNITSNTSKQNEYKITMNIMDKGDSGVNSDSSSGVYYIRYTYLIYSNDIWEELTDSAYTIGDDIKYISYDLSIKINKDTVGPKDDVNIWVKIEASDAVGLEAEAKIIGPYRLDNVKVSGKIVAYSRKSDASEATASNVMLMVLESDEVSEEKEVEVMELVELEEEHEEKEVVSLLVEEVKEEKDVGETVTYKPIVEDKIKVGVEIQYSTVIGGVYLFAKKRKRINVS